MRNYHVMLSDGTERDVTATDVEIDRDGSLVFYNGKQLVLAYNYQAWKMVEVERLDDKG